MSQFDLNQLSKKNQEFIRIAKHQLLENGKSEEEAESLIQEILPAIHENQGKGIPARTLFGAPTVWANSFSEKERYEKEHPKLNDAPSLMILDSFLFIFGVFAAISAFMNLVAPRRTGYGLITLILGSLTGALLEDTLIETQQAIEMADIYGNILHSMTDTFASIISNNQNNIMKTLAMVTIVMSIPTMIFSAYGMNFKDNELPLNGEPNAFWLIIFIAFALTGSLVVYLIHKKWF